MTLHLAYDHQCEKCGAHYIPYDKVVPCPKCGLVESNRFDYIKQAVDSLRFNKYGGSYTPTAWYVGSLGDHILNLLFPLFDAYEEELPADFAAFAQERLLLMNWGNQKYLRCHILEIAIRLKKELAKESEQ